nr:hypothetical protein [uncultured Gellertiella sp.]
MPTLLKQLSLALGLLTSDRTGLVHDDGWQNYVWRVRPASQCVRVETGYCQLVRDRWDWKRDQRYVFSIRTDLGANRMSVRLKLDNRDPADTDNVCVVALFLDDNNREVAVFYQDWQVAPKSVVERSVALSPSRPVASIARVALGSRQCDGGAPGDAANFARLQKRLKQR